jgi:hypothetical protein
LVEELVEAKLLEACDRDATGDVRYRFHELIRLFGQERSEEEDDREARRDAVSRAAGAWLRLARCARRGPPVLRGRGRPMALEAAAPGTSHLVPIGDPVAWFEAEEAAMTSVVQTASRLGLDRLATAVASVLSQSRMAAGWSSLSGRDPEVGCCAD